MEDKERIVYDKLIQMYEEKIQRLEAEKGDLMNQLLFRGISIIKNPFPQGPNDWPYNQPYWGVTEPTTGQPIGPQYTTVDKT